MPLSVGDRLGPYEILAPIGAGGMGEVYRARDTKLKRPDWEQVPAKVRAGQSEVPGSHGGSFWRSRSIPISWS